uniref:transposase n=1 Tax=Acidaminococcus fermentans TaxID=905 RepID=UPI00265F5529
EVGHFFPALWVNYSPALTQAEGTFGVMKNDREYDQIVRRGMDSVKMEVFLVSIGFNLYKYHRKQQAHMDMAA